MRCYVVLKPRTFKHSYSHIYSNFQYYELPPKSISYSLQLSSPFPKTTNSIPHEYEKHYLLILF